jgi:hypothetical protein
MNDHNILLQDSMILFRYLFFTYSPFNDSLSSSEYKALSYIDRIYLNDK